MTFTHPYPYAQGQSCHMCADSLATAPASHKVEEVTDDERHPFTAYVCCRHFALIMGKVAARWCAAAESATDPGVDHEDAGGHGERDGDDQEPERH